MTVRKTAPAPRKRPRPSARKAVPFWRLLSREVSMQITPRGLDLLVSQGLLSPGAKQGWQKALMRVFKVTPIEQRRNTKC
jgi:hypothetical protein